MKNYLSTGDVIDVPAPAGGAKSGAPYLVGKMFGFFNTTADEGMPVGLRTVGKFQVTRPDGAADWAVGDLVYWNDTDKKFTKTATGAVKVGFAVAASTGTADGMIKLVPSI